jgi:hypothetical protein
MKIATDEWPGCLSRSKYELVETLDDEQGGDNQGRGARGTLAEG